MFASLLLDRYGKDDRNRSILDKGLIRSALLKPRSEHDYSSNGYKYFTARNPDV